MDCSAGDGVLEAGGGDHAVGLTGARGDEELGLVFDALVHVAGCGDEDELEVCGIFAAEVGDDLLVLFLLEGRLVRGGLDELDRFFEGVLGDEGRVGVEAHAAGCGG